MNYKNDNKILRNLEKIAGNGHKKGYLQGRTEEQEKAYLTIDHFLRDMSEKKTEGTITDEQYRLIEATAISILTRLKGSTHDPNYDR